MDALNSFMLSNKSKLQSPMRVRLRAYMHQSRHVQSATTHTELLKMLSPALQVWRALLEPDAATTRIHPCCCPLIALPSTVTMQAEIAWKLNRQWLKNVSFLQ